MLSPIPDRHTFSRPAAFTLIEMLAVVAIISVLAALLLPSINQMKKSGYAAGDVSGLRQLGIGMLGYAGDHENKINQVSISSPTDIWPDYFWTRAAPYMGSTIDQGALSLAKMQSLANQFPNRTLASMDTRYIGNSPGGAPPNNPLNQPFAFNARLFNYQASPGGGAGKATDHFRRMTEFTTPATTPYIAVGRWMFTSGTPTPMPAPTAVANGVLWPYTGLKTIVVYLDGHAAARNTEITDDECWGGIAH